MSTNANINFFITTSLVGLGRRAKSGLLEEISSNLRSETLCLELR
jgi:hypothetical protein